MSLVAYDVDDDVALIRLDRPDRLNAMSEQMRSDLVEAFRRLEEDDAVRAAILTGTGRAFCAGRDLKAQAEGISAGDGRLRPRTYSSSANMFGLPDTHKPLVAAVNGFAIGQGWYMVLDCDVRVASSDAEFAMAEVPTGTLGPYWLAGVEGLPWAVATEFCLLGERITADRLLSVGMLNAVVAPDDLMGEARRWAAKLAALPPRHVQTTKRLMRLVRQGPDRGLLDLEKAVRTELSQLADSSEAVLAWRDRRPGRYQGR
ncbi:enoyl-CoA hydratase [Pseudonocardia sulfidoxydans NBRC 16205]|uniref:Enoyl-CoA hydratase n=1 Tax=Pseudonocardia sulfidoxydans NBRC 16205 TaxID=1223511 RepID=A0A511D8U0_9PSEU|nr:enoyl-CoA hydratase/isomerase family protein [Pseudonocardia sulfidoxydans]GEL21219.1 enoyl-CoA hydratase [Pseudonocardia sulfidoxydans NBRC 16205]